MPLPAWAACCFAIALAGTWLARKYALRARLLDHPDERRSHSTATPRGGGIAIVAAVSPVLAALWLRGPHGTAFALVLGGLVLVAGIGWWDDHRPLSPAVRLAVHAVAAALLAVALRAAGAGPMVAGFSFLLALVLVNMWNFMDGIDGIAGSQALVGAAAYALFAGGGPVAWVGVALAAACAGFLPFNLPRARIFLGDVGSGALGYLLAALAALSLAASGWKSAPLLLLPLLAFGVDASLTLARRMRRGERWWLPHVQHAYQVQARRHGHGKVTAGFFAFTIAASAIMLAAKEASPAVMMYVPAGIALLACVAWRGMQADAGSNGAPGSGVA